MLSSVFGSKTAKADSLKFMTHWGLTLMLAVMLRDLINPQSTLSFVFVFQSLEYSSRACREMSPVCNGSQAGIFSQCLFCWLEMQNQMPQAQAMHDTFGCTDKLCGMAPKHKSNPSSCRTTKASTSPLTVWYQECYWCQCLFSFTRCSAHLWL